MKRKIFIISLILILCVQSFSFVTSSESIEDDCFGFIVRYTPEQSYDDQRNISCLLNKLLNQKAQIYWTCEDISILTKKLPYGDGINETRLFKKGSILVSFTGDPAIDAVCTSILYDYNISGNVEIYHLMQGLTNLQAFIVHEPKIVHYDLPSVSSILYYNRLKEGGFLHQDFLDKAEVLKELTSEKYNVLIWAGQAGDFDMVARDQLSIPALFAKQKIKRFIKDGGGYVGSCHGAAMTSSGNSRPSELPRDLMYLKLPNFIPFTLKIIDRKIYRALPGAGGAFLETYFGNGGSGVTVRFVNQSNPVSFGLPEIIENHEYLAGPMFLDKKPGEVSNTDSLGIIEGIDEEEWNWDFFMDFAPWWNSKITPDSMKTQIINKWVNYSIGKTLWATAYYGHGKVVAFGGHPEYPHAKTPPRIVYNAIFYAASEGPKPVDLQQSYSFLLLEVEANGPYVATTGNPEIQFNGTIINKDEVSYSYCWSFGDGDIALEQDPIHTYSNENIFNYTGVLTVASDDGNIGLDTASISIKQRLTANVWPEYGTYNLNESISFLDESNGGFPPYNWYWVFGDGTNSTVQNPEHTYLLPCVFQGNLMVSDSENTEDTKRFVIALNTNISHSVTLEIEDVNATTGHPIIFSAYVEPPPDGESHTYLCEFNFDDGSDPVYLGPLVETLFVTNHSYAALGSYYPTVHITDVTSGCEPVVYCTVEKIVVDNQPPDKPNAPSGPTLTRKKNHYKYCTSGSDPDGDRLDFKFDWGDGTQTKWGSSVWYSNDLQKFKHGPWMKRGICEIRVKTRDKYGIESPWSDPLIVKVI